MRSPFDLLWPAHWLRVLTGATDFTANPVLRNARLNAWGLHAARMRLAHAACRLRRHWLRRGLAPAHSQAIDRDGYLCLQDFLPPAQFAALRDEVAQAALPVLEMAQPPALTRRINLDAQTCAGRYPALHALLSHAPLLRLVRYTAGYPGAPIIAIQCVHGDAPGATHDPQTDWHVDTFHATAKAWLFLHEVGAHEGPFAYWPGSQRVTPARLAWTQARASEAAQHPNRLHAKGSFRATAAELEQLTGCAPFVAAVPGNTLVVGDTSGFHRRTPSPGPTVRVEVYLSLRRNPFFAGLYPSVLGWPLVRSRWASWAWRWYRHLQATGRRGWTPAARPGLDAAEREALGAR